MAKRRGDLPIKGTSQKSHPTEKPDFVPHVDVREHLREFFDSVDKLGDMEIEINRDLLAVLLLYSLPTNFGMFRCAIESRDELSTPEVLRVKIIEESNARNNNRRGNNNCRLNSSDAMLAKNQWRRNENKDGSSTEGTKRRDRSEIRCFKCKKKGHKTAECRSHRAKVANVSLSASKGKLNLPR